VLPQRRAVEAGAIRGIEHHQGADVSARLARLEREEDGIAVGELVGSAGSHGRRLRVGRDWIILII
jgi:hypothetical protein